MSCISWLPVSSLGDPDHSVGFHYDERDGTGEDYRPALAVQTKGARADYMFLAYSKRPACQELAHQARHARLPGYGRPSLGRADRYVTARQRQEGHPGGAFGVPGADRDEARPPGERSGRPRAAGREADDDVRTLRRVGVLLVVGGCHRVRRPRRPVRLPLRPTRRSRLHAGSRRRRQRVGRPRLHPARLRRLRPAVHLPRVHGRAG